jgi:hypothetical protein
MPRRLFIMITVLVAILVAGCDSSAKAGASSSSSVASTGLKYARCMRTHGVPNFPDPGSSGEVQLSGGTGGINPNSPAFEAAQKDCGKLLPYGGFGKGPSHASVSAEKTMLAIAECMRAHGISGFPDPTTTRPASMAGLSGALGYDGVYFAFPDTLNLQSPAAEQAEKSCNVASVSGPGPLPG